MRWHLGALPLLDTPLEQFLDLTILALH